MANVMFHDHTAKSKNSIGVNLVEQSEHERQVAQAYAKGRSDAFASLGLDEKDFPAGDGLTAWTM